MGKWDLEAVERAFADAAINPANWNEAMNTVAAATQSVGAVLLPVVGARMPHVPESARATEANQYYFRHRWHERDERSKGIPIMMRRGLVDDLDLFDEDYIKRHPYYQEFLATFDYRWFAGIRVAAGDDAWCLSIQRSITQGPFSTEEKRMLLRLSQTLSASAVLGKAFGFAAAGASLETLESSGSAALLVNRQGEVYQMNRAAQRMLTGDVRIVNKRLTARDAKATMAFDRAMYDLLWQRSGPALSPPVVLPRSGRYPLLAYPITVSAVYANPLADCKAIVVLVDLDAGRQTPESVLRATFMLTEAEARLAARMASGDGIETVATELGLSRDTIRSQLKAVFAKTSTHRQGELIALLSPLLRAPE
jgi:DNA-binding CsgD family transcriptional regulator